MADNSNGDSSRRQFLAATAATAAAGGTVFGLRGVRAQQTSYAFGGVTSGWRGRRPESISGTTNPTLNLEPGTEYEVTWENVDGAPHNFAVLSGDGEVLVRTELISQGSQTVTFTAQENMATYLCQAHPSSMRGRVQVGGGGGAQANQTTTGTVGTQTRREQNQTTAIDRTRTTADETVATQTRREQNQTTAIDETTTGGPQTTTEEIPEPPAGTFGEDPRKFLAELRPGQGVQTDATGRTYFTLHPPNGERARILYSLYAENANDVTGAQIRLDQPDRNNPVVVQLFEPTSPVDAVQGSLADTIFTARDLRGPFEGQSLVPLVEAMSNGDAFVEVQTRESPDGLLRGPIRPVDGAATLTAMANRTTTAAGGNATGASNGIDSADIAQQAQTPGFGVLPTLGGLAGVAGYLLSRGDDE